MKSVHASKSTPGGAGRGARPRSICATLLATVLVASCATNGTFKAKLPPAGATAGTSVAPASADVAQVDGLPAIGKWMLDRSLVPAHWIGEVYLGRRLREPINVIIVDRAARSPEEAKARLMSAAASAGYPTRGGHSGGYLAYIGDELHHQLSPGKHHAFANEPFFVSSDHGRIFGPHAIADGFVFIAAFSRETLAPLAKVKHAYASFNHARVDFSTKLHAMTSFRIAGHANLGNRIDDAETTTGDHDGRAVWIEARE